VDLAPWELEEQKEWRQKRFEEKLFQVLTLEQKIAYEKDEVYRQKIIDLVNSLLITTQTYLPDTKKNEGVISAYDCLVLEDEPNKIVSTMNDIEASLLDILKIEAMRKECNAIIAYKIDKSVSAVSFDVGGGLVLNGIGGASYTVHFHYLVSVNVYGTAVLL
jgi:hypothetical protein